MSADTDKLLAAINFIKSRGAERVQVRYYDEEEPEVWVVVALFKDKIELDTNTTALEAALRLCERLVDGTMCRYCRRRIILEANSLGKMPYSSVVCWYQYDPELKVFRRSCE